MVSVTVEHAVVQRLLSPEDPALKVKVLTDLLDYPVDDPEVAATRRRVAGQPWVKATLDAHNGDGTWGRGFYHKYDGTSWVLLHLSEVGVPMDLPQVASGIEHLLDTAAPVDAIRGARGLPFHDLPGGMYWKYPIACLTAHMALVLLRAGLVDHAVTRAALRSCAHRFEAGRGFGCFVVDDSLLPACVMTVPKVLKAFLAIPADLRTTEDESLIEQMVQLLKGFGLYRYVPREAKEWREWAHHATASERRVAKPQWIASGRVEPRQSKDGWLRFSFPHSYNSDLLEVLLLVGEVAPYRDEVVDAGLEVVLSKRGRDGTWKMVGGLNGKMHADLDRKGKPSPWITYRALLAFKRFGLLEPIRRSRRKRFKYAMRSRSTRTPPPSEDHAAWEAVATFWHERMGEGNDFVDVLVWPTVRRLLPALSGARVLDVGCGNGLYARKLAAAGASVLAVDYSERMLDHAREATDAGEIDYGVMDAADSQSLEALPTGEFEAVLSTMALMDMSDIGPLFRVLPRVLKPGGSFVFATAHPSFNSPHATLEREADAAGSIRVEAYQTPSEARGAAIRGQPAETLFFHRSLADLLRPAFESGLVLDALEEAAFPAHHPQGPRPDSWGGPFHEFPAVLVGRVRPRVASNDP
jgi:2-polyprenyl-3-methyl-5-hydroxy-6-metoxy-1,4-benzoquinol methylase